MEQEAKQKVRIRDIFKRNAVYVYRRAAEGKLEFSERIYAAAAVRGLNSISKDVFYERIKKLYERVKRCLDFEGMYIGGKEAKVSKNVVPSNKRSFSLVTVIFCIAFIVYIIQFEQTRVSSTETLLSDEIYEEVDDIFEYPSNSCRPQKNIVFLKTHKCASSSIQNIFMRYGYRRGLTFVLPAKGSYVGHPEPFNWSMVPDARRFGLRYNILTHHCRLNYDEMRKRFPSDLKFVTIVRHPVELYESLFSFYSLHNFYRERFDTIGKHQRPPGFYDKRMGGKIGFNQMLFDLGMNDKLFSNLSAVQEYVYFLDSIFDLVMVREKMEESLVLLRDLLCWKTDDVVIFHLNARNNRYKRKMNQDLLQRLVKFNSADMVLYQYFVRRLAQRVKDYGREKMEEEVGKLKNRTRLWYNICVQKQDLQSRIINSKRYYVNRMVMAYVKKNQMNETCDYLTTQEAVFTEKLLYKQRFMFPTPKPYRSRYKYRMHRWR